MVMAKYSGDNFIKLLFRLKQSFAKGVPREIITASSVAACLIILRSFGLLQFLEWSVLDKFFKSRPEEAVEKRITIVEIDEASLRDIGDWPIPDGEIAKGLRKLQIYQPRVIGLDIYRDLPVGSGHSELIKVYKSMPDLIGIQLLAKDKNANVAPPKELDENDQVGFNNIVLDSDGKVRRMSLYWHQDNLEHKSFSLKVALKYLQYEDIIPRKDNFNPGYLRLGKTTFIPFKSNDGSYVNGDDKGYQILSNFPKPACQSKVGECRRFQRVSFRDILANRVAPELIRNKIVLIGSTAPSLQDYVLIPYSSNLIGAAQPIAGVELQAYFISELISAAKQGRPLLKFWSEIQEILWIVCWAYVGVAIRWGVRHNLATILIILFFCICLAGASYGAFLFGWWIPFVPALLSFCTSAMVITYEISMTQEEMKRSKEFLDTVINTIADPIFVKNEKYEFVTVNHAFCQFIGYPLENIEKASDFNLFPIHEAEVFRSCDNFVLCTKEPSENEEEFTDAQGQLHFIATKRSLHQDSAGNVFLVGVIRDITTRKKLEEELKKTAAELVRSNDELKQQEDRMRYLAYHDVLTGLPNRKFFAEKLHESLQWAKENNLYIVLFFIDLDGFKQVNDTLGHEMGDRLLVTVAQRLSNCLRGSDTVSRLGGDEFTVILRTIPNIQVAQKVANKILCALNETFVLDKNTAKISASIGISIYPLHCQDPEILIQLADAAMYKAKHSGKNCIQFA
jgi:diguanylate cyclase (GGDEF)-like protein/PAS domain S-box-containing protein